MSIGGLEQKVVKEKMFSVDAKDGEEEEGRSSGGVPADLEKIDFALDTPAAASSTHAAGYLDCDRKKKKNCSHRELDRIEINKKTKRTVQEELEFADRSKNDNSEISCAGSRSGAIAKVDSTDPTCTTHTNPLEYGSVEQVQAEDTKVNVLEGVAEGDLAREDVGEALHEEVALDPFDHAAHLVAVSAVQAVEDRVGLEGDDTVTHVLEGIAEGDLAVEDVGEALREEVALDPFDHAAHPVAVIVVQAMEIEEYLGGGLSAEDYLNLVHNICPVLFLDNTDDV